MLFTSKGVINIKNKKFADDYSPIDADLPCETSQYYSKAYLRHLFAAKEILGLQIASIHNLSFYLWLVGEARKQIQNGSFKSWKECPELRAAPGGPLAMLADDPAPDLGRARKVITPCRER